MTVPPELIELRCGAMSLAVRADLGACIADLRCGEVPVLRSEPPLALASARRSGCYPLVPYSNRIAWRRFEWDGHPYTTEQNFDENPHSVHGNGWQRAWQVTARDERSATLELVHAGDAHWPFAYVARQSFLLDEDGLRVELSCRNTAEIAVPIGLGWHPYFPKRSRSRIHAELTSRWESDPATELPVRPVPQAGIDADVAHLQFDHCFDGWRGPARARDEKLAVTITSSCSHLVVFTPQDKPYYCVEPVSHVSNAIHLDDPIARGLRRVAPGESASDWMRLDVVPTHA